MAIRPEYAAVPFDLAIKMIRDRVPLPSERWTDMWQGAHARAFVIAGAKKLEMLESLKEAVLKADELGTTLDEFRRDFDHIIAAHGWSYRGTRNWRTRVIFETNLRVSYNAGRWAQAQETKGRRPYARYSAVLDDRTRPAHRSWHGTILPVDHPWWRTHWPPNGWGCRCTVITLSERQLRRLGWKVSEVPPSERMVEKTVYRHGARWTVRVPEGIDPGWAYNPGIARWGAGPAEEVLRAERESRGQWRSLEETTWRDFDLPPVLPLEEPPAERARRVATREELLRLAREVFDGDQVRFDVAGLPVWIDVPALAAHIGLERSIWLPLVPDVLTRPREVWLDFEQHERTGRVRLRLRVLKAYAVRGGRGVIVVIDGNRGFLAAWTTFPASKASELNKRRRGRPILVRKD